MNSEDCKKFITESPVTSRRFTGVRVRTSYRSRALFQHPRIFNALDALTAALQADPIKKIIEIGTARGGFTAMIRDHDLSCAAVIESFDIETQGPAVDGVVMNIGDCFGDQKDKIVNLCQSPGRTLLFCDGGNKVLEINTFCQFLKTNDVIACHDYVKFPDRMLQDPVLFDDWTMNKSHGWDGCESQWSTVQEKLTESNFIPFCEDVMQLAFWGCFIKI